MKFSNITKGSENVSNKVNIFAGMFLLWLVDNRQMDRRNSLQQSDLEIKHFLHDIVWYIDDSLIP